MSDVEHLYLKLLLLELFASIQYNVKLSPYTWELRINCEPRKPSSSYHIRLGKIFS